MKRAIRAGIWAMSMGWAVAPDQSPSPRPPETLSAKITYEHTGAPVGVLLGALSPKAGVNLLVSPRLSKEIVAVQVKDVPVRELLDRIAKLLDARWEKEGAAMRLVQSAEDIKAEEQREKTLITRRIERDFAKLRKEQAATGAFDAVAAKKIVDSTLIKLKQVTPDNKYDLIYEAERGMERQSPAGRALQRILLNLRPDDLAQLPQEIRVDYATAPTPMQRSFPFAIGPILADFRQEQTVWSDAVEANNLQIETPVGPIHEFSAVLNSSASVPPAPKVILSFLWLRKGSAMNATLSVYGTKGDVLATSQLSLGGVDTTDIKPAARKPNEPILKASADEAVIRKQYSLGPNPKKDLLSSELWDRILHPERAEPLGIVYGAQLVATSKLVGQNLVASLGDSFWRGLRPGSDIQVTGTDLLNRVRLRSDLTEADGWLQVRPLFTTENRRYRVDRNRLGAYLRDLRSRGPLKVAAMAKWSLQFPIARFHLADIMARFIPNGLADYPDYRAMWFFGSLSDAQRKDVAEGLPFASLAPSQRDVIFQILYGPNADLEADPDYIASRRVDLRRFPPQLMVPSEGVPNGITADGFVTLKATTADQGFIDSVPFSAEELGHFAYGQSRPDLFPAMQVPEDRIDLSKVRFGSLTTYAFAFRFKSAILLKSTLIDQEIDSNSPTGIDKMPESFRKAIEAAIEVEKKKYANKQSGGRGTEAGKVPPPV